MTIHFNSALHRTNDMVRKILIAIWAIPLGLGFNVSYAQSLPDLPGLSKALTELANPNSPVASDGSIVLEENEDSLFAAERASGRSFKPKTTRLGTNGFEGSGITGSESGAESETHSSKEVMQIRSLKPATGIGIQSIIGTDQRVFVSNTAAYPFRTATLITFSGGRCSGALIGKDTVLTAGHCVHGGGSNGTWKTNVRVYPGHNGTRSPFGSCGAKRLHSVTGWTSSRDENFDYGAVKLDCDIGLNTGWLGWHAQTNTLNGITTYISGYPGDKPLTQWYSADRVRVSGARKLFYSNDTTGGMSGSPVVNIRPTGSRGCVGYCTIAVHANGLHGVWPHNRYNHGTRITSEVNANLLSWRNAL